MAAESFQFADFELDRAAYTLRRRGCIVRLERIPLDLLLLLVERRGQLVTRKEIVERIWGKQTFLDTQSSINTAVRKLRRVLHDDRGAPRFIVTVPAKGYRFIGEVYERTPEAMPGSIAETAFRAKDGTMIELRGGQKRERRHLTVLFYDLLNSSRLAPRHPEEEWWENVAGYHRAAAQAIERYRGHVGSYRALLDQLNN